MSCVLRRDPDWIESISSPDEGVALTLLTEDGCQVPVPAALLAAVSPLVKSMMADLLPPSYSPHVISIPAVTADVLLLVAEILTKGSAAVVNENMEEVQEMFKIMRIEAFLSYCVAGREVIVKDNEVTDDGSQSELYVKMEKIDEKSENDYVESDTILRSFSDTEKSSNELLRPSIKNKHKENKSDKECDRIFACDQCNYKGARLSHLVRHNANNHGTKLKYFKCDLCAFKTANNANLNRHMLTHTGEKPFACDQCDYKSRRLHYLDSHKASKHEKENENPSSFYIKLKPFACDQCYYRAASNGHFKRHMLTHTGEKPFACDQCDYRGSRSDYLDSHKASKHENENVNSSSLYTKLKPFQCQVCEYQADRKPAMVLHVRRHSGERLSEKDQCENNTGKSHDLGFHKLKHAEEKQLLLLCDQCEFMTNNPVYLSSHKKRKHPGNLQQALKVDGSVDCIYCEKKCKNKKRLEKHMKKRHSDKTDLT